MHTRKDDVFEKLSGVTTRLRRLALMSILPFLLFAVAALAQDHPGQINDPSTYKGSMANQAQERATYAAQEAQNQQMLNRLDQDYAAYAPKSGGGSGGGGRATVPPLKSKP